MKAILTLSTIIFFGTVALAQDTIKEVKTDSLMVIELKVDADIKKDTKEETKVARLYMFKNSRIKKALKFKTKRNKSKLA